MQFRTRVDVLGDDLSLARKHWRLAAPVALSMVFHTSYSVVDMFWVSRLGAAAIAAVTLAGTLFFLGFALTQVFGTGVAAVFARVWGAGQQRHAGRCLRDSLAGGILAGAAFGLIIGVFAGNWLRLLGASPAVLVPGTRYLHAAAFLFPCTMPLFILSSAWRASGDTVTPLVLTTLSTALNIALDPLLIFGWGPLPGFGVAGAAAASVLSALTSLLIGVLLARFSPARLPFAIRGTVDWQALRDVLTVGAPSGAHYVLLWASQAVMLRMVASFGTPAVAATGVAQRITQLSFLPCMALGASTATMVGQFLGAGRPADAERAVRSGLLISVGVSAAIGALYAALPDVLLKVFTREPGIIAPGRQCLRVFAAGLVFVSFTIILTRAYQGAGATRQPMFAMLARLIFFLLLGATAVHWKKYGPLGVWLAMAVSHAFQAALLYVLFRGGDWKRRRLASVEQWAGAPLPAPPGPEVDPD